MSRAFEIGNHLNQHFYNSIGLKTAVIDRVRGCANVFRTHEVRIYRNFRSDDVSNQKQKQPSTLTQSSSHISIRTHSRQGK